MLKLKINSQKISKSTQDYFAKLINDEIKRIQNHLNRYPHQANLKINIEQVKNNQFIIKAILFLDSQTITIEKQSDTLRNVVEEAFDSIKSNLIKKLDKEKTTKTQKIKYEEVPQEIFDLILTKNQPKQISYSEEIKKSLPSLQIHISKLFTKAQNLNLEIENLEPTEILQQTVEFALENYANLPSNLTYSKWLFEVADQQFKKEIKNNYKKQKNLSWETLLDQEIKKIEEKVTIDADGDFQLATGPTNSDLSDEKEDSNPNLPDELIVE